MTLPARTQVLVVGAGPCGLVCAIALARLGLQVAIVEALPASMKGLRAPVIHAHTLEVLDTIGLAKTLVRSGVPSRGLTFHGGTEKLLDVDTAHLRSDTEFPFVLLIPQQETERILRESLASYSIEVFYNRTAVGMKEALGGGLDVSFEDGAVISAQYVVGADGSKSTIRRISGVDFKDPHSGIAYNAHVVDSATFQITLADVSLKEPLPATILREKPSWYMDKPLLLVPAPAPQSSSGATDPATPWRLGIVVPIGEVAPPRHPDIHYLQKKVDERNPWASKLTIIDVLSTPTTYRVRSAVASTFFKPVGSGKVLLIGDAAHVHSPSGGQGMNLGMCDAVALARAICANVDAVANEEEVPDSTLSSYSSSRRKTAIKVIGMTKRLTAVINATGWRRILRNVVLWVVGGLTFVRKLAAWRLSGLGNRD